MLVFKKKKKKKRLLNTEHCIHSGVAINITVLNRTQPFLTLTKRERRTQKRNRQLRHYTLNGGAEVRVVRVPRLCVAARAQRSSMAPFSLQSRFQFTRPRVDRAMAVGAWESSRCIGRCTPILVPDTITWQSPERYVLLCRGKQAPATLTVESD